MGDSQIVDDTPYRRQRQDGTVPVIGGELAELLLRDHEADVLMVERCGACGLPFPCPSRAFAAEFFNETEQGTNAVLGRVTGRAAPPREVAESTEPAHPVQQATSQPIRLPTGEPGGEHLAASVSAALGSA